MGAGGVSGQWGEKGGVRCLSGLRARCSTAHGWEGLWGLGFAKSTNNTPRQRALKPTPATHTGGQEAGPGGEGSLASSGGGEERSGGSGA